MNVTTLHIASARLIPWRGRLRAVKTARGRVTERRGWWLELTDNVGRSVRGEAAPLPRFGGETHAACRLALTAWSREAAGCQYPAEARALGAAITACSLPPVARAAVSQALFELLAQQRGQSVSELLSARPSGRGLPDSHVLVRDADDAAAAVGEGAKTLKIKVGSGGTTDTEGDGADDDMARVRMIRARVGDDIVLRLDANGGWSPAAVRRVWPALIALRVDVIEEPCDLRLATNRAFIASLRDEFDGPGGQPQVFADEACRSVSDLATLSDVVDGVVVKPMLVGGVDVAATLCSAAAQRGLSVIVTTSFGTERDLAASVSVARTCTTLWGCGLDPQRATVRANAVGAMGLAEIPHPVWAAARQRPEQVALRTDSEGVTWSQMARHVARRAAALRQMGVGDDDIVAMRADATVERVQWMHAVTWVGAILAPVDARAPAATTARLLRALCPDFYLVGDDEEIESAASGETLSLSTLRDLVATTPHPTPASPWRLDGPRFRLLTSGSTGTPDAIDLTAGQVLASVLGSAQRLGHAPTDIWLNCLPLHHTGGLSILLRCAMLATTTHLLPRFDATAVRAMLLEGGCTQVSLVPAWLHDLLAEWPQERRPAPMFRVALIGGDALTAALRQGAATVGLPLAESWGMTEAASQVATRAPWDREAAGPGAPLCVADIRADANDRLHVHGPLVASGSLQTGDSGRVKDAQVTIFGRADACFQSGGEHVDPRVIEAALCELPQVEQALVVGLPDARLGHRSAAIVVLHPPPFGRAHEASPAEEIDWRATMTGQLRHFLVPNPILELQELPRTALGKPDRAQATRLLRTAQAHARAEARANQPTPTASTKANDRTALPRGLVGLDIGGERSANPIRQRNGAAGGLVHTGVDMTNYDTLADAADVETKRDGAGAQTLHYDSDAELFPESHGRLVVSLDMDERHHPRLVSDDVGEGQPNVDEQSLEGDVGELEGTTKEHNPDGVDFGEADGMLMNKLHGGHSKQDVSRRRLDGRR